MSKYKIFVLCFIFFGQKEKVDSCSNSSSVREKLDYGSRKILIMYNSNLKFEFDKTFKTYYYIKKNSNIIRE